MKRQRLAALFAALSLMLPIGALANHYVKITPDQWHLIGITGYYSIGGRDGTAGTSPDLGGLNLAIIDDADLWDNISWDMNESLNDPNIIKPDTSVHFTSGSVPDNVNDWALDSNFTARIGLPYHSILGLRALKLDGSLEKAVIAISRPSEPVFTKGKQYQSPIRVMRVKSPLAGSEPDVVIFYQASLENHGFRISFKSSRSDQWDFANSNAAARDKVYEGNFSRAYTYLNPASVGRGLTVITETAGTGGTAGGALRSIANTVDMNITDNNVTLNTESAQKIFQALEGNLTAYHYNTQEGVWAVATVRDAVSGKTGFQSIPRLNETGTGGGNTVDTKVKGDFTAWTKGFGYWVRLWADKEWKPGILASGNVQSTDYVLHEGWNQLAFNDSRLRYTSSGFFIPADAGGVSVVSPFGDTVIPLTVGTGTVNVTSCLNFNDAASRYLKDTETSGTNGKINRLDVRCYVTDDAATGVVLLSDKPFYIIPNDANGIQSLAGYPYDPAELLDINGTGSANAYKTRLGEFALALSHTKDYNSTAGSIFDHTISFGVPAWLNANAIEHFGGSEPYGKLNGRDFESVKSGFTSYFSTEIPSAYKAVRSINLSPGNDLNATDGNLTLLAADVRFYVNDASYVRKFDLYTGEDRNGSRINVKMSSSDHASDDLNHTKTDCANSIYAGVSKINGFGVDFYFNCLLDTNETGVFLSNASIDPSAITFDVKETVANKNMFTDALVSSSEKNDTVYGAISKVYQISGLVGLATTIDSGGGTATGYDQGSVRAVTHNLTDTPIWAEDFPNDGPIYAITANGYKPEMFITAVTAGYEDLDTLRNGEISWKALDITRDPKDWFNNAESFELFWAEKERGYWVYLGAPGSFTNEVNVSNVIANTPVVTKHFNDKVAGVGNEYAVFNWYDGSISATIKGLVRPGYTSGESYDVTAIVGGIDIPMATAGALIQSLAANFAVHLIDFEVDGFSAGTTPKEALVIAVDGLGGSSSADGIVNYVKPATPNYEQNDSNLTITSNQFAKYAVVYDAATLTDEDINKVGGGAFQDVGGINTATVDLSAAAVNYPGRVKQADLNETITAHKVPDLTKVEGSGVVASLRIIAATEDPDGTNGAASVFSNARGFEYLPAYAGTAHIYVKNDDNETKPFIFYGDAKKYENDGNASMSFGVALRSKSGHSLTLVFKPLEKNDLSVGTPQHADLSGGNLLPGAQIQWIPAYDGQVFYVYDHLNSKWYYGIFPSTTTSDGIVDWADGGYNLALQPLNSIKQTLAPDPAKLVP
jgi:hypothetical protein